ncbi:hypothetical protein CspeluHIS016_0505770 [Cutaneotrichosporon spelunceum]|uniref:Peptidoglycan binding-like domain-containing protein n=1 Tax=Cutaneotrichosporon spelunceum TaxID=1672016 RepID=A0AAD3TX58_9TREE|nr:hypothetical protein CspeluHIS016_0505770 [Cutaneotrichosporon spelunceum]
MRLHFVIATLALVGVGTLARPNPAPTAEAVALPERDVDSTHPRGHNPVARDASAITKAALAPRGVGPLNPTAFAGAGAPASSIRALQYLLQPHTRLVTDGIWGPATQGAVRNYQAKSGLVADGIPGPATLGSLAATVRQGSGGAAVRAVQSVVGVAVDGDFGPATRNAVISYQRARGLAADGIVGRDTWSGVFSYRAGSTTTHPKVDLPGTLGTGRCPNGQRSISRGVKAEPNGCGAKGGIDYPDLIFTKCCNTHDICYSDCSRSKAGCDGEFGACLRGRCDQLLVPARPLCYSAASIYIAGVVGYGQDAFDKATKRHCKCA